MKRLLVILFLSAFFLGAPSSAQDVLPPEAARVIPGGKGVLLRWPGSPREKYFLQITAGQVIVMEAEVTGNQHTLEMRSGLGYQWKVSRSVKGGYQALVPTRRFQVVNDQEIVVQGVAGRIGKPGTYASHYRGGDGDDGKAGLALTATLTPVGDYVSLLVTGAPANRQFYFSPGAAPLLLATPGGDGGAGGTGYKGRDGSFYIGTRVITPAEAGGDGGRGGKGGNGGTITVVSNGLPVERYLHFDTRGGEGGLSGAPGLGGRPPIVPAQFEYRYGYALVPGANGMPGQPGIPGRDGQVVLR